jgi:hypothetical protein
MAPKAMKAMKAMASKAMKAMKARKAMMKAMKVEKSYKKVWATQHLGKYCQWHLKSIKRARQYEQRGLPPRDSRQAGPPTFIPLISSHLLLYCTTIRKRGASYS